MYILGCHESHEQQIYSVEVAVGDVDPGKTHSRYDQSENRHLDLHPMSIKNHMHSTQIEVAIARLSSAQPVSNNIIGVGRFFDYISTFTYHNNVPAIYS